MKSFKLFVAALAGSVFLASCTKDDVPEYLALGRYDNGLLVLNEGNAGAGSVSFINSAFTSVSNNIFDAENPAESGIGGYAQSIFFDAEKAFIISGAANKITVVNRYTFKVLGYVDSGLTNPRYGVVVDGKAYVTNSNTFSWSNPATGNTDDYIAIINLQTLQVESTINLNTVSDKILLINDKLYVTNGTYGDGSSLQVIDPETNSIVKTLNFGNSPNSIEENNGKLYVLCSSFAAPSELVRIDLATDAIESTIIMPATLGGALNLNVENNLVYFTVNSNVYASPIDAVDVSDVPLFTAATTTLYGMHVRSSAIYLSDAKDYVSNGEVFVYGNTGILIDRISVGLLPNNFYFN